MAVLSEEEKKQQQGLNEKTEKADIEAGNVTAGELYPKMEENPKLRWAFIRKVYVILAIQFLFTAAVAATFNQVGPIVSFVEGRSKPAMALYIASLVLPLIVLFPLLIFRRQHPINVIFLGLFTICISFSIGWISALTKGWFLLEAAFVTFAVLVVLTLYTFWAAKRGLDFGFLAPFLLISSLVLLTYLIMLHFFRSKAMLSIYGCLATIVYSGFIIFDTDNLIKRHKYDEYTAAAISLYLDAINMFLSVVFIPTFDL